MPRISVIIPAYNAAATIAEAIGSVQAQRLADLEILVVDDCSTDSTAAIVADMAALDPRIRLITMPENSGGAFAPRALGFTMAEAPLVAPLDADDSFAHGYLEALMWRREQTGAPVVLSAIDLVDTEGNAERYVPAPDIDTSKVYAGRELVRETLGEWRVGGLGLFDRELVVDTAHSVSNADHPFADEVFTRRLFAESPAVAICDEAVYLYRRNPASVTHRVDNRTYFQRLDLHRDLLAWADTVFAADSEEYALFHRDNALALVAALRDRYRSASTEERAKMRRNLALADLGAVRHLIPARYYFPLRLLRRFF